MNQQILEKAVEDINLIKQVIERTTESLISSGRIFLWWGIILSGIELICFFADVFRDDLYIPYAVQYNNMGFLLYLPHLSVILTIFLVYYFFASKNNQMTGLSKKLMFVWLYIISFNVIYNLVDYIFTFKDPFFKKYLMFYPFSLELITFSVSIALFCTSIFTRLKLPAWLGFANVFVLIFIFVNSSLNINPIIIKIIVNLICPITFLILGGYLEMKRIKGN